MTQYIDKSAVVAEMERRISLFKKEKKTEKWSVGASQINVVSLGARIAMLEEILSFLDTLEVKEVNIAEMADDYYDALMEEAAREAATWHSRKGGHRFFPNDYQKFIAGANWMKEKMTKTAIEREVKVDAGGYPYIDATKLYDYDNDKPLAKAGDRVKVVFIKDK